MGGVAALHILRSDSAFRGTTIDGVDGTRDDGGARRGSTQGFDEVIAKPCLPEDLLAAIERIWKSGRRS